MRTDLYQCSTLLGLATALILRDRTENSKTKGILLLSINSRYPEVENPFAANPWLMELAQKKFDEIVLLNDLIHPFHPSQWKYERGWGAHRSQWLRAFRATSIDRMFLESIQVAPAWTLAQLFPAASINVYSDGLMVYSPTRVELPGAVRSRISTVYYVEYVPGLVPLLLREAKPTYTRIDLEELRPFFASTGQARVDENGDRPVIVLGQALAQVGMTDNATEVKLYVDALRRLSECPQVRSLAFKPHTAAAVSATRAVATRFRHATRRELRIIGEQEPLEAILASGSASAVVGVFSTGLFTASRLYRIPVFSFGTKDMLYGLEPYQNSNRIPLVLSDLCIPPLFRLTDALQAEGKPSLEQALSAAHRVEYDTGFLREVQLVVGYYMQPKLLAPFTEEVTTLREHLKNNRAVELYFKGANLDEVPTMSGIRKAAVDALEQTLLWTAERILPPRKYEKLQRDPDGFFSDSQIPSARALGELRRALREPAPLTESGKDMVRRWVEQRSQLDEALRGGDVLRIQ